MRKESLEVHLLRHKAPRLGPKPKIRAVASGIYAQEADSGAVPVAEEQREDSGAVPVEVYQEASGAGPVLVPKAAGVPGYHRLNLPPAPPRPSLTSPTTSLRPTLVSLPFLLVPTLT